MSEEKNQDGILERDNEIKILSVEELRHSRAFFELSFPRFSLGLCMVCCFSWWWVSFTP
jgi:hypothetical protein